jgi:hypothetical protein
MISSGAMTPSGVTIHALSHSLMAALAQLATLIQDVTGAVCPAARLGMKNSTPPELTRRCARYRVGNA